MVEFDWLVVCGVGIDNEEFVCGMVVVVVLVKDVVSGCVFVVFVVYVLIVCVMFNDLLENV